MAGRFWGCAGMGCPCLDEEINCPSAAVSSTCAFVKKKNKNQSTGVFWSWDVAMSITWLRAKPCPRCEVSKKYLAKLISPADDSEKSTPVLEEPTLLKCEGVCASL